MKPRAGPQAAFTSETVWNAGLSGTGVAGDNRSLTVGHEGEWAPEHLLLLAAESCFMSTLLSLASAAGVKVLGYVSSGHLHVPGDAGLRPVASLMPCVVVGSPADKERIALLARQAEQESVLARVLGEQLRITLDVQCVSRSNSG